MAGDTFHSDRPRPARGGVLIAGGGVAGGHVARGVGEATVVNPSIAGLWTSCPKADLVPGSAVALDPETRVVTIRSDTDWMAIAYADLVIAVGPNAGQLGLPVDRRGRVLVDETLRVVGVPHVWAVGDCAALPNGDGEDVIGLAAGLARRLLGVRP
jgi:NADH dehydrogenase FAD-containing subunit